MKPCISQVTTLMNPFEADATSYRSGGWNSAELWLTKLEAFVQGLRISEVQVASRTPASAQALVERAKALGVRATAVTDPDAALAECPLVVTSTSASV